MLLHRIHLNVRSREVRRDLADPYQLHATLCRAFAPADHKCSPGEFLWRLEPESGPADLPRVLVQSRSAPDWDRINLSDWLAQVEPAIDLNRRLELDTLQTGDRFRFRLRANPTVTRNRKRLGLFRLVEQEAWVARKGEAHGFTVPRLCPMGSADDPAPRFDVSVSQEQMLRGRQHTGNEITIFSVLYDGILTVTDAGRFRTALATGIGHAKVFGLGLLSVVPSR